MHLDLTITIGNIITLAGMVGAVYLAYGAIRERLVRIETQLAPLWDHFTRTRGTGGTTTETR